MTKSQKPNIADLLTANVPETPRKKVDLGEVGGEQLVVEIIMPSIKRKAEFIEETAIQPDPDNPDGEVKPAPGIEYTIHVLISQTVYPGTDEKVFNFDAHKQMMLDLPADTPWLNTLVEAVTEFVFKADFKAKKK